LIDLIDSEKLTTVAVACYDLGEFCRFHPFGRSILENQGGKAKITNRARHSD
jgi:V-type H+-transporting ATPase subunit H